MAGFTLIEDTVLGSAAASITFNTGLTDYTQFRLTLYVIKDGTNGEIRLRFNGDTGTNYADQRLYVQTTSATGQRVTGQTSIDYSLNLGSNGLGLMLVEIAKPLTTTPARVTSILGNSSVDLALLGGEWNNTADLISSISILPSAGNFAAGTRAVLEGWTDSESATLSPVTFTLTSVAPAFILGTPALFKTGSYIPIITKKKVG